MLSQPLVVVLGVMFLDYSDGAGRYVSRDPPKYSYSQYVPYATIHKSMLFDMTYLIPQILSAFGSGYFVNNPGISLH
ncbi:hypothetical protein F4810DRAFT_669415, partial [Camillea tinctor]